MASMVAAAESLLRCPVNWEDGERRFSHEEDSRIFAHFCFKEPRFVFPPF